MFKLDPKHESFNLFGDLITQDIWRDKYAQTYEKHPVYTFNRVVSAVYKNDPSEDAMIKARMAMHHGLWMPGGRILSGAGTAANITMMNCYVSQEIPDSIEGIFRSLQQAASTLSAYGGIGMNFGTIRPSGARIKDRGDLSAPGPLTFMKLWHEMSDAIKQAGHRRGAMMGVLPDWHPDLLYFIGAKREKGALTNFNISVLISDGFMESVKKDLIWKLYHTIPPAGRDVETFVEEGITYYVYSTHKARGIWDLILQNTYEYSEPGVIFIDQINNRNNLQYCEKIGATNPCGEQPLPPNGTCNLGAINLARMVKNPFESNAYFDFDLLKKIARIGVRFLDNVIDITNYPLLAQEQEEKAKRRLGMGISGLADALAQLGYPYGSSHAQQFVSDAMSTIAVEAYSTSAALAIERGAFPLFKEEMYNYGLAKELKQNTWPHGLRNGVLLTIAPTGTTSMLFGNISSGIEPVIAHQTERKVIRGKGNKETYISWGFGARFYAYCHNIPIAQLKEKDLPKHMIVADQVDIYKHVAMQAAAQKWVDASISKTINCPADISYEDFKNIYTVAYDTGCKGCTTYRPSEVRGAIITKVETKNKEEGVFLDIDPTGKQHDLDQIYQEYKERLKYTKVNVAVGENGEPDITIKADNLDKNYTDTKEVYGLFDRMLNGMLTPDHIAPKDNSNVETAPLKSGIQSSDVGSSQHFSKQTSRPRVLQGCTYKINWPRMEAGVFLTINEQEGQPWEIFIQSKDLRHNEWTTALSVMISRMFQQGEDPLFIADQFKQMQGMDGCFIGEKYYASLPCYIGHLLHEHFSKHVVPEDQQKDSAPLAVPSQGVKDREGKSVLEMQGWGSGRWESKVPHHIEEIPKDRAGIFALGGVMAPEFPVIIGSVGPETLLDPGSVWRCPKCGAPIRKVEGCKKCTSCDYSNCE